MIKGILCAFLGLVISMFGTAPIDNAARFTFGWDEMKAGFSLLPVLIGLFAVSQIITELLKSEKIMIPQIGRQAFYPVCQAGYATDVVAVKKESPWNTIEELMGYIKSNPGKVRLSVTIGATTHFTAVEMDVAPGGGNKIVLVAGKENTDWATKLLGGASRVRSFPCPVRPVLSKPAS